MAVECRDSLELLTKKIRQCKNPAGDEESIIGGIFALSISGDRTDQRLSLS